MDTSYLTQQVTSIIGQLHNLFDEIGVPHHERDSRESELFSSLSETLHNHLRQVSGEKNEMVEQAQRIITTIKQMEESLDDQKTNKHYAPNHEDLEITYPLTDCLQTLKDKHRTISKLHQERYEQVRKLVQALESYSSHLESSFVQVKLPPTSSPNSTVPPTFDLSPSYINSVDAEFTRVYEEYTRRIAAVQQLAEEIIKLWAELGTPQAQTDATIIHCWQESPEQLGLHQDDINKLKSRREKLQEEKRARERKLKDLRTQVEQLWDRLGVEEHERKGFIAHNRGCGLRNINDLEDELSRLNELKRQNLHLFVEDARTRLNSLWDELYFSEEEAVEFTPMFCDVVSDALLSAHEAEIARLEALKEQRAPTLALIDKHRSIVKDKDELAATSQDASRLIVKKGERRDPTRLLREEKMRKRIARELPKVEAELAKILEKWEDEYGRPFLVFGERYLDVIQSRAAKAPPPRSKTPNALPDKNMAANKAGAKTAPQPSRSAAASRDVSTVRSKAQVEGTGTLGRGFTAPRPANTATNNNKSPSRIPARAPLGHLAHGGNSPERKAQASHLASGLRNEQENASRSKMPLMAPPPKMRDLRTMPPTPSSSRPAHDVDRSGSIVRHVAPEDPYSDGHHAASRGPMAPPPRPAYTGHGRNYESTAYASSVASSERQMSGTSSVAGSIASSATTGTGFGGSGNENWETYDSDGGDEDARATPRAYGNNSKRPFAGQMSANDPAKKLKTVGLRGNGAVEVLSGPVGLGGRVASDQWTDEEAF